MILRLGISTPSSHLGILTEACGTTLQTLVCKKWTTMPSVWMDFALFWSPSSHPELTGVTQVITIWCFTRTIYKAFWFLLLNTMYLSQRHSVVGSPFVSGVITVFLVPLWHWPLKTVSQLITVIRVLHKSRTWFYKRWISLGNNKFLNIWHLSFLYLQHFN